MVSVRSSSGGKARVLKPVGFSSQRSKAAFAFRAKKYMGAKALVFRLKYNVLSFVGAFLANVVRWLIFALALFQLKDKVPFCWLVKGVTRQLIIYSYRFLSLHHYLMQLCLKAYVRELRFRQLVGQLHHGGFDLRVATCLRVADKFIDGACNAHQFRYAFGCLPDDAKCILDRFNIKVHKISKFQNVSFNRLRRFSSGASVINVGLGDL